MDLSEYKGIEARVSSFILPHSFLAVELYPESSSELKPKYILCYWCQTFPSTIRWMIDNIQIHELDTRRWLVTDWKRGIVIPCGNVQVRDHFDLRHYLAVEEETVQ